MLLHNSPCFSRVPTAAHLTIKRLLVYNDLNLLSLKCCMTAAAAAAGTICKTGISSQGAPFLLPSDSLTVLVHALIIRTVTVPYQVKSFHADRFHLNPRLHCLLLRDAADPGFPDISMISRTKCNNVLHRRRTSICCTLDSVAGPLHLGGTPWVARVHQPDCRTRYTHSTLQAWQDE